MAMPRTFAYQRHAMHACIFSLRWQVKCLLMMAFVMLGMAANQVYAQTCPAVNGFIGVPLQVAIATQTLGVPSTNTVQGPIAAGNQIGNIQGQTAGGTAFLGCTAGVRAYSWIVPVKNKTGIIHQTGYGNHDVYPTGVDGIGYIVASKDFLSPTWRPMNDSGVRVFPFSVNNFFDYGLGFNNIIFFVATSPLAPGTYVIPRQQIAWNRATGFQASINSSPQSNSAIWLNQTTIIVTGPTCSLSTSNATFDMGTLSTAAFTGGPGTHLPSPSGGWVADQSLISAGCNASTVAMTFAGTAAAAPYNKAFANAGSARGVALELWQKNGTQVTPNSSTPINFSPQGAGGRYTFSARYLQTEPTVTAGTVNARVTVTVNYK